jgi:tight adherence protein B
VNAVAWAAGVVAVGASALLALWPRRVRRARWQWLARRLRDEATVPTGPTGQVLAGATRPASDDDMRGGLPGAGREAGREPGRRTVGGRLEARLASLTMAQARRHAGAVALATAGLLLVLGGPIAALVGAIYAVAGVLAGARSARRRVAARAFDSAVDGVATLAAELRAGVPAETAVRDCAEDLTPDVSTLVGAAVTLAGRTGAPLAAVLDRLDQQLRAALRLRATVTAQAAGARASAYLLAVLPLAGVGLGPLMGVSPAAVLLHTPLGAGCLLGAVALQLAGLAWAARLARPRGAGVPQ